MDDSMTTSKHNQPEYLSDIDSSYPGIRGLSLGNILE